MKVKVIHVNTADNCVDFLVEGNEPKITLQWNGVLPEPEVVKWIELEIADCFSLDSNCFVADEGFEFRQSPGGSETLITGIISDSDGSNRVVECFGSMILIESDGTLPSKGWIQLKAFNVVVHDMNY